ncbi:MAG: N-acetylglucosamine-6-phosphate deacetylase [Sphaerobacter sp.]|nr:N-acetylglucosamine-6-phosphate deacetylase [Sphaerobacter sp.]
MALTIEGARLVDAAGEQPAARLVIEGGRIVDVGPEAAPRGRRVDARGMIVTPGFIDLHTHGGGGFALHTTDPAAIHGYARWASTTGTTAFLIGVVGVPGGPPLAQLRAAAQAMAAPAPGPGAEMLGIHLEGPYLNPARRGAHDPAWLRQPDADETAALLAAAGGRLRLVTLAPELPRADALIRTLVAAGVTVSLGHTDATYEQAREAIRLGVSQATHCFNAMRPLHHRDPGPLAAVVEAPAVRGELIADGVHVHPAAARLLIRALGPERVIAVTDAQAVTGLPDAVLDFSGLPARVVDGAVRLADGTLAGSALTTAAALRNLVAWGGVSLPEAVGMLSWNPARAIGVDRRKGRLRPGYDADLLLFDAALTLQATLCRGAVAHATAPWRERLA